MEISVNDEAIERKLAERRKARAGASTEGTKPHAENEKNPTHYLTAEITALLDLRCNVWLTGPAGSGKSKCAELCALSLNLPYSAPPIGRETPLSQLFGYFNASGQYVRTPIRECAENGGVLHLEEIDFALLANDFIGFPDKVVKRHPDFIVIASANTYGNGANASYIGSQGLNAATLDRFVFVSFDYDIRLESIISTNKAWAAHVQAVRKRANDLNLKIVFSPRASIVGSKMINSKKFTWERTEELVLWKNLDALTIDKLKYVPVETPAPTPFA
jgi:MoxR-like ATPase